MIRRGNKKTYPKILKCRLVSAGGEVKKIAVGS
jgi:hypothetical protein